ncbi:MAG: retroviral-like aspartic protease family protein [Oscillospiraceae bacterium]|nr:retroviral-like aspartic protease family protein [Oscillospiraceae bacterium]
MNNIKVQFELVSNVPEILIELKTNIYQYKRAFILFDTGASMTATSMDLIMSVDHRMIVGDKTEVSGFGGKKSADYAILSDLVIGGVHLGPVATLVAEFSDDTRYDVILGMNILKNFNLGMSYNSDAAKDGIITLQPRFDITELNVISIEGFDYKDSRFGIWNLQPERRG